MAEHGAINGTIACKSTGVTDESSNQIGDFRGEAAINIVVDHATWKGQNIFIQDDFMTGVDATLNFSEVAYNNATVGSVWGITAAAGSTKEATPVTATVYEFDTTQITSVPELEWLATVERGNASGNKKFQVWAAAGRLAADFPLSMTHGDYIVHDLGIQCFLDDSNDLIHIIWEQ